MKVINFDEVNVGDQLIRIKNFANFTPESIVEVVEKGESFIHVKAVNFFHPYDFNKDKKYIWAIVYEYWSSLSLDNKSLIERKIKQMWERQSFIQKGINHV
jgi:hypothetical protein